MKFALFSHVQVPKDAAGEFDPEAEHRRFTEVLEQSELADALGFDYVFFGEHHVSPEYSHNSSPEVLLAALSRRTRSVRLATGIVHISHNDPIRTAERFAAIDVISGGRVELGFGYGAEDAETYPWLLDRNDERRERGAEAMQIAVDVLGHAGRYPGVTTEHFEYPAGNYVPHPYQRPHMPFWMSGNSTAAAQEAARRGFGLFSHSAPSAELVRARVEAYWTQLSTEVVPTGQTINPATAATFPGLVARSDEEALTRVRDGLDYFEYFIGQGESRIGHTAEGYNAARSFRESRPSPLPAKRQWMNGLTPEGGLLLGGVDSVREQIRQLDSTGLDIVTFTQSFGLTRHEHALESLELIGREIIPEFHARHAEHVAWRAERLERVAAPVYSSVDFPVAVAAD